nr:hypothetical protein [Microbacterium testaceum]
MLADEDDLKENDMAERKDRQTVRPSGSQIVSWAAIVFCALLALLNAATVASSAGMRVFLIAAGVVLIGIFVTLLARWYVKRGNPAGS